MNKDHWIWKTYEDCWIRVVGQQTTLARTCGIPHQQGYVSNHVSEYTWNNQMMTSVKRKLVRAMSTSDVSKLRHSGRISSGVSPPRNVKSPEVLKDEGPKELSAVDLRYYPDR
jgi:hypothetical protein